MCISGLILFKKKFTTYIYLLRYYVTMYMSAVKIKDFKYRMLVKILSF